LIGAPEPRLDDASAAGWAWDAAQLHAGPLDYP
jgi:hypothetical protein